MIRIVLYLLAILAVVVGLHWLADRPGPVTIDWLGYILRGLEPEFTMRLLEIDFNVRRNRRVIDRVLDSGHALRTSHDSSGWSRAVASSSEQCQRHTRRRRLLVSRPLEEP